MCAPLNTSTLHAMRDMLRDTSEVAAVSKSARLRAPRQNDIDPFLDEPYSDQPHANREINKQMSRLQRRGIWDYDTQSASSEKLRTSSR